MMTHVSTSYHLGMGVVLVAVAPDTKERVTYATITRLSYFKVGGTLVAWLPDLMTFIEWNTL